MRESNSRQRFWRPLSYHLTNPLYINIMRVFTLIYYIHLSFVFQVFFFCTFKTSHRSIKQTLRKFDSLRSSNDQTTNLSLLSKAGHLDSASLHLDDFAPQNRARQLPQFREQVPSLCSFPCSRLSPLLVKPSTD